MNSTVHITHGDVIPFMDIGTYYTDYEVSELFYCLSVIRSRVIKIAIQSAHLSRETFNKFVRYVANNNTLEQLVFNDNTVNLDNLLEFATAIRTNTSLKHIQFVAIVSSSNRHRIILAFIHSFRLNFASALYIDWIADLKVLYDVQQPKSIAEKTAPPSMLEIILHVHPESEKNKTKKH